MFVELGRGESVVSLLCLRIFKQRRKRKRPATPRTGPASEALVRHPGERSRHRNKAEVKGYISKIEDASFDVTDKRTGRATTIPYADVEKVQGSGLSKGAKIGIIAGAAVVTVAVVIAAGVCRAGYC